jgi:hypothetical protein
MTKPAPQEAQLIAPDAYPQMINKQGAARALQSLRGGQVAAKVQVAMQAAVPMMRAAILQYADEMEEAAGDMALVYQKVHEIRGFAETAGLVVTGRISEILCRYMDDMERSAKPLDTTIVALNVSAIIRAARAEEVDTKVAETVTEEMAALVALRLAEAR